MNSRERESGRAEAEMSDPVAVVREMFDAFARGDVAGILETVDPDSRWIYIGANPEPRRASLEGHEGVRRFFQRILDRLDMSAFEPREFVVQGPTVVVFGSESGVVRKTRKPFHNEWVQKYVVRNGKITEMEEFNLSIGEAEGTRRSRPPAAPRREERIDDALRMTFPASDPPSWPSDSEDASRRDDPSQERKEMIGVTGATGNLGRLVVNDLLERGIAPERIRALVRSPEKAGDLAERGVEVRRADYTEPDSLRGALEGVDKLLLVSSSEVGQRVRHHRNVIDAAVEEEVGLLAYTSILKADTSRMQLASEHRATEELIHQSGIPFVMLRNGWYVENYTENLASALEHGALLGSANGGRISAATRADFAAAAAEVLTDSGHESRVYELGGKSFTLSELAETISRLSGRRVEYRDLPEEEYAEALIGAGLPEPFARVLADSDRGIARGELFTESDDLRRLIGRPATSPDEAVRDALEGGEHGDAAHDDQEKRS